jgi:hypothetical protein
MKISAQSVLRSVSEKMYGAQSEVCMGP